jgi:GTP-binding protein HflX
MAELTVDLGRGVSLLIDRRGRVSTVAVGDAGDTPVPPVHGEAESRLHGLRLVHTHTRPGGLSGSDLAVLFTNRLDAIVSIDVSDDASGIHVRNAQLAMLAPPGSSEDDWIIDPPVSLPELERHDMLQRIAALEEELARNRQLREVSDAGSERAILVGIEAGEGILEAESRLEELAELARSAGAFVAEQILQVRARPDPRTLIGRGKLQEVLSRAFHQDAGLIIFDRELTPGQAREIDAETHLKVLDRTQLILDIFAQNARGLEAQVQVELAQLQYQLPRLAGRGVTMSRLAGGIGTRGPGETKLEMDRRRIRERIRLLEKDVDEISKRRYETRRQRTRSATPLVALVGYTNAGKSTLFNLLAKSDVLARSKLFATLRPTTREAWLPDLGEWGAKALFTDTVGFIRDLPEELINAFRATLEELHDADYLLHVVDAAAPGAPDRVDSVNRILDDLELKPPRLIVLNKADIADPGVLSQLMQRYDAIPVSAVSGEGIPGLQKELAVLLGEQGFPPAGSPSYVSGAPLQR